MQADPGIIDLCGMQMQFRREPVSACSSESLRVPLDSLHLAARLVMLVCLQERKAAFAPNAAADGGHPKHRGRLDSIHSESSGAASSVLDQLAASLRLS